jgi:redox-sensitive bicupin YhaK (pirin superfamily)
MSAGTGIRHSEFNPSATDPVHLYQIWLLPRAAGLSPSYEQKAFPADQRHNRLRLVASPTGEAGSLTIQQDARLYLATLDPQQQVTHDLAANRHAWLQVLRGWVELNGQPLATSDGAAISNESRLNITAAEPAEVLLFDLA